MKRGISVLEVVIAVSIIAVIAVSVIAAFHFYLRAGLGLTERVQAVLIAEEGFEAVRYLRDDDWDANIAPLSTSTTYHLAFSGTGWEATTTAQVIDDVFVREVAIGDVYRDDNDDIVPSTTPSARFDPNTRKVNVSVRWNVSTTTSGDTFIEGYLTNFR